MSRSASTRSHSKVAMAGMLLASPKLAFLLVPSKLHINEKTRKEGIGLARLGLMGYVRLALLVILTELRAR